MKRTLILMLSLVGMLLSRGAQAFYNSSTGRWLSRDPIAEPGLNPILTNKKNFRDAKIQDLRYRIDFLLAGRVRVIRDTSILFGRVTDEVEDGREFKREADLWWQSTEGRARSSTTSQDLNSYGFVLNDPIGRLDPKGLQSCEYFCLRGMELAPFYVCMLMENHDCGPDGCDFCVIVVDPTRRYRIFFRLILPCNGCDPHRRPTPTA